MLRAVKAFGEHWRLSTPFRISRGVRTQADLIVVEVAERGFVGRGEGAPISRYGSSVESSIAQVEAVATTVGAGLSRRDLLDILPAGAARNALDSAMWDLEAQCAGVAVSDLLGAPHDTRVVTAKTISLDTVAGMSAAAAALGDYPLIKVKVDAEDPAARIAAVRAAAPAATLIVDANEAWNLDLLVRMQPALADARVAMLEQPLAAGRDELLDGFAPAVPICADESCHVAADVARLAGRYQAVNIKLDKTGGLTAALDLLDAARAAGMGVMTGCMICTSLSIAPAYEIARRSDFADLDGPLWLASDRPGGIRVHGTHLVPPAAELWGGAAARHAASGAT